MQFKLVSMLSDNVEGFVRGLAGYLSCRTGLDLITVEEVPWQERERMLDRGEARSASSVASTTSGRPGVRTPRWISLLRP
jgi:hypothetical protein